MADRATLVTGDLVSLETAGTVLQYVQMLLLSEFLKPIAVSKAGKWLPPVVTEKMIEQFIALGKLAPAPLDDRIGAAYKVSDLKKMLSSRGLPVSGAKSILIGRLIDHGFAQDVSSNVFVCSDRQRNAVEDWLSEEDAEVERISKDVIDVLRQRDVEGAKRVIDRYNEAHPSKHSIMAEWRQNELALPDPPERTIDYAKIVLSANPGLLRTLSPADLERVRLLTALEGLGGPEPAYAMASEGYVGTARFDDRQARAVLRTYAHNVENIQRMRSSRVMSATISVTRGCPVCAAYDGKIFSLDALPQLPLPDCHEVGCFALIEPVIDFSNMGQSHRRKRWPWAILFVVALIVIWIVRRN